MDAQQQKIAKVQDMITDLDNKLKPGWTAEIQEKIETIQDHWDAMIQIIEVQRERVSSS